MRPIDQAIDELGTIVEQACVERSPLGIFPAMYREVTRQVRTGMAEGLFADPDRMERMVVSFADLYVGAADAHRRGRRAARSWEAAFTAAEAGRRLVAIQHLLLGMNAHINLDLGVATAGLTGGRELEAVHRDFITVNEVLFSLVNELQDALNEVSPWMAVADRVGWRLDEGFMRLGLRVCRDQAWHFATRLVQSPESEREAAITERDAEVAGLARFVTGRLSALGLASRVVATRESRDVVRVIEAFEGADIDLGVVEQRAALEAERPRIEERPLRPPRRLRPMTRR